LLYLVGVDFLGHYKMHWLNVGNTPSYTNTVPKNNPNTTHIHHSTIYDA